MKRILKETTQIEKEQIVSLITFMKKGVHVLKEKFEILWDLPFPHEDIKHYSNLHKSLLDTEEILEIIGENVDEKVIVDENKIIKENKMDNKTKKYISLLEKYSGKKVFLKEADEATKNQAVNNLQFIKTSISNVLSKIEELQEIPILTRERNITLNKMSHSLGKIDQAVDGLIEEITATRTDEQEKPLDEDVSMSTDDIIKNPQVVKKLSDNKVDIKVKDKNMRSSSSSSAYR